jgi:hypothetical protein
VLMSLPPPPSAARWRTHPSPADLHRAPATPFPQQPLRPGSSGPSAELAGGSRGGARKSKEVEGARCADLRRARPLHPGSPARLPCSPACDVACLPLPRDRLRRHAVPEQITANPSYSLRASASGAPPAPASPQQPAPPAPPPPRRPAAPARLRLAERKWPLLRLRRGDLGRAGAHPWPTAGLAAAGAARIHLDELRSRGWRGSTSEGGREALGRVGPRGCRLSSIPSRTPLNLASIPGDGKMEEALQDAAAGTDPLSVSWRRQIKAPVRLVSTS